MQEKISMGHGAGGLLMQELIEDEFFCIYGSKELKESNDAAILDISECARNDQIAYSTDSFVVDPIFFPGGNIGKLAVCGTVNDVATSGAIPKFLSCAMIIEEGFPIENLRKI